MALIRFIVARQWSAIWIILTQHRMSQTRVKADLQGYGGDPTQIWTQIKKICVKTSLVTSHIIMFTMNKWPFKTKWMTWFTFPQRFRSLDHKKILTSTVCVLCKSVWIHIQVYGRMNHMYTLYTMHQCMCFCRLLRDRVFNPMNYCTLYASRLGGVCKITYFVPLVLDSLRSHGLVLVSHNVALRTLPAHWTHGHTHIKRSLHGENHHIHITHIQY